MDYVKLGRTGLQVSRICLGMMTYGTSQWRPWILDEAESRPIVKRAVDLGINFFDTADMYTQPNRTGGRSSYRCRTTTI